MNMKFWDAVLIIVLLAVAIAALVAFSFSLDAGWLVLSLVSAVLALVVLWHS